MRSVPLGGLTRTLAIERFKFEYYAHRRLTMQNTTLIALLRAAAALSATVFVSLSASGRQSLSPEARGDCPGAPHVGLAWPEISAPAHRQDIDLQRTEPASGLRVIAWRVPCAGSPAAHRLFLRLSTQAFGNNTVRFPRFTVVQNGVELGTFNAPSGVSGDRRFLIHPVPPAGTPASVNTTVAPLVSNHPSIPFDVMQGVTLLIRPAGWPADRPDVRMDIPAANIPGNHGFVPARIAGQWWNPARPGWGLTLARNERETVFAAWMTYDDAGDSTWFVMPYSESTPDGTLRGAVYAPQGRPFGPPEDTPTDQIALRPGEPVGTFGLRFLDENTGEFTVDIQGVRRTEPIKRQRINATDGTACTANSGAHHDPRIDGWGLGMEGALLDRRCVTQLTFLTYDTARKPVWYFVPMIPTGQLVSFSIASTFPATLQVPVVEGDVFRPRGTPWRVDRMSEVMLGQPVGRIETPKLDNGAGMRVRIGNQEAILLPQLFLFEF